MLLLCSSRVGSTSRLKSRATDETSTSKFRSIRNPFEVLRTMRTPSELFRAIPNRSESAPHHSEGFRMVPPLAEHKASHTLTTREAARRFEDAGVARTERTTMKWCQVQRWRTGEAA